MFHLSGIFPYYFRLARRVRNRALIFDQLAEAIRPGKFGTIREVVPSESARILAASRDGNRGYFYAASSHLRRMSSVIMCALFLPRGWICYYDRLEDRVRRANERANTGAAAINRLITSRSFGGYKEPTKSRESSLFLATTATNNIATRCEAAIARCTAIPRGQSATTSRRNTRWFPREWVILAADVRALCRKLHVLLSPLSPSFVCATASRRGCWGSMLL